MRRVALWLLVALLVAGAVSGLALLARRQAEREATVYTDGSTIAVPAKDAPLRTILWTPPEPLPGDVNTPGDDSQPRVSLDGSTLFFVRGRAGGGADIWWARRDGDAWADPAPIDAINTTYDELTPCPTPRGDALVFASDRPAGVGGYDLWIARRDGDTWSSPVWLGDKVNTPHNDYAPSLSPEGLWLWYASNRPDKDLANNEPKAGEATIDPFAPPTPPGDYDIYRARLIGDAATSVTRIESLCSEMDDVSPAWSPAGDFVYFASNRAEDTGFDLYRVRIADGVPLAPEPLGPTINTARDELDPGVALGGFELLFSIALPADDADDSPDLDLARSLSREVYPVVDRSRLKLDLSHIWDLFGPWLLWLLLLLFLLLLLLKFRSSPAAQGRWRKMSLLARCLLLSMLIHALLLALLGLWRVSAGIGDLLEDEGGMRIRLTSSRAGVESQIAGGFVEAPAEVAQSASTSRAQAQAESAPATLMQTGADRAALSAEQSVAPLAPASTSEDAPTAEPTEVATAAAPGEVSTPVSVRSQAVGEDVSVETIASASDPARASAEPEGAAQTPAAIDPGATRTERAAMTLPSGADAPSPTSVATAEPSTPTPFATTSMHIEEGQRVANAEQAESATPIARSSSPPTPSRAIEAGAAPTEVVSTTPGVSRLTPTPTEPTALTLVDPSAAVETSHAQPVSPSSPRLATTETSHEPVADEMPARETPVATNHPSARAGETPTEPIPGAMLVQSDPASSEFGAIAIDQPTLTDNTPRNTDSGPIPRTTPTQGGVLATNVPSAERAPTASEVSSATLPAPALERVARAPGTGDSTEASEPIARLAPSDATPTPPTALTLAAPSDATQEITGAPASTEPASAPPLAAVTLPTDREPAPGADATESIVVTSTAPSSSQAPAPVALTDASSEIEPVAPSLHAIEPEAYRTSTPSETAASDVMPSMEPARIAAAQPAISTALPEAPPAPSPTESQDSGSVQTPSNEARRANVEPTEGSQTIALDRIDPTPSALEPTDTDAKLPAWADAAPQPAVAVAAPPAAPAPTLSIPSAASAPESLAAESTDHPDSESMPAPARAAMDAEPRDTTLVLLDAPASESTQRPTPSAALADADAPAETPALALDLSPRATNPRDLPPLPAEPVIYPQRDESVRMELVEKGGGSEETEKAVADALAWLARNQSNDGHWSSRGFERVGGPSGGPSRYDFDVAATSLALLCFYGADHTPIEPGPYQDNVARALDWLLHQEGAPGEFRAGESMYSQAIATIALCESYAMTRDAKLLDPIRRAIAFVLAARNTDVGGWRYEPGQPGDTSVLGWMVMAFESARRCGIDVDPVAPASATDWLDTVMDPSWPGRYAYRPGMESSRSMTAEGMFVRQLLRIAHDDPRQAGAARYVLQDLPRWNDDAPTYQWYYATLALFQHGGGAWDRWNRSMSRELVTAQRNDGPAAGSWDPTDRYAQIGGRIYQTAICTLSLEVYYRYLPMYVDEPVAGMGGE
ncbi:MAG: hypothetical protein R3B57_14040 [Phycisphaerales bacterium]